MTVIVGGGPRSRRLTDVQDVTQYFPSNLSPSHVQATCRQGFPRLGRVTSALDSVLDTASRTQRVLDVTDLMMRASFDAVAQLGFHHDFGMVPVSE